MESGRPPVGFVDSWLARVLEVELGRALAQLAQLGGQAPEALDKAALAQLKAARRPQREVLSQIDTSQPAGPAAAAAPQVSPLKAALLADESMGPVRTLIAWTRAWTAPCALGRFWPSIACLTTACTPKR